VGTEEQCIQRYRGTVGTEGQIALSITAVFCPFTPVNSRKNYETSMLNNTIKSYVNFKGITGPCLLTLWRLYANDET